MIDSRASQRTAAARRLLEEHGLRRVPNPKPRARDPRLSHAQERIWIDQQLAPYSSSYNCAALLRIEGALDERALCAALRTVVERHAPLRSVITMSTDGPRWERVAISDDLVRPLNLEGIDDAALAELAAQLAAEPFDLTKAPPVRVHVGRAPNDGHVLVLVTHHIAWDGASTEIFFRELERAYREELGEASAALTPLASEYEEYVAAKRERGGGGNRERLVAEAKDYFTGMPDSGALPADFKRVKLPDSRGERTAFAVDAATRGRLEAAASAAGGTLFHGLLALTASFIARQSEAEEVAIAVPVIDRPDPASRALIGLLLDTVVVRIPVAPEHSFKELVRDARDAFARALELRDLPLGDVLGALADATRRVARPTIGVLLTLDQAPASQPLLGERAVSLVDVPAHTARFDFGLSFVERDGALGARLEFASDLYAPRSAKAYTERLARFITSAARDPNAPLADLPMLSLREKRSIVRALRGPRVPAARDPLASVLDAALENPGAPAISAEATWDYSGLVERAHACAALLRREGVRRGDVVAVLAERHPRTIVAILALWLLGATVAPLDPEAVDDCHLGNALGERGVSLLLGAAESLPGRTAAGVRTVALSDAAQPAGEVEPLALVTNDPEAGAYLLFTSGSTGTPNPVLVRRKQLAETLAAARQLFAPKPGARVLWSAGLTFDIAFLEIFLALTSGGCAVLHGATLDLTRLAKQMEEVDVFHAVPSVMQEMIRLAEQRPMRDKPVRPGVILVGGETVTPKLLQSLRRLWPAAAVSVLYGPTEATIICASRQLRRGGIPGFPVLGSPHRNVALRITGERGNATPVGVAGELWIGGATVADGYAGEQEQERFVMRRGSRWFRTGDRVRLTFDGDLEFLGRLDHQEKIRGVRVEPALVENIMRGWVEIADVVVMGADLPRTGRALVAYAVPSGRGDLDAVDIRERLAREVSAAAVPGHIVWLDAFPKNRNGKVDRAALATIPLNTDAAAGAPGCELEQTLASLWCGVLGRGPASRDDSFYALGGDSLGAMRLLAQIRRVFGVSPAIDEILLHPTLRGMARLIAGEPLPPAIAPARPAAPVAATAARLAAIGADQAALHEVTLRIESALDERSLRDALARVAERHDALYMRVVPRQNGAFVLARGEVAYDLVVAPFDAAADDDDARAQLRRHHDAEAAKAAALRVFALIGVSRTYLTVALDARHGDRASLHRLLEELAGAYSAAAAHETPQLPPAPSFLAYAEDELGSAANPRMRAATEFWTHRLASLPGIPVRFAPKSDATDRDVRRTRLRFQGAGARLGERAAALDVTEFSIVLAALAQAVDPRGEVARIAVRTTNRARPGSEALIGPIENVIYADIDARGNPPFAELAGRTMETLSERYLYDGVSQASVLAACAEAGIPADALDTQLLCGWNAAPAPPAWGGAGAELVLEPETLDEPAVFAPAGFALVIDAARIGSDVVIEATFDACTVPATAAERIARSLGRALDEQLFEKMGR